MCDEEDAEWYTLDFVWNRMNEYLGAKQIIQLCIDQKSTGADLYIRVIETLVFLWKPAREIMEAKSLSKSSQSSDTHCISLSSAQRVCFPSPTFLWTYFLCTARNYLFSVTKRKFRGEKRGRDRRRERECGCRQISFYFSVAWAAMKCVLQCKLSKKSTKPEQRPK